MCNSQNHSPSQPPPDTQPAAHNSVTVQPTRPSDKPAVDAFPPQLPSKPTPPRKLAPRQFLAIRLLMLGLSDAAVARKIGVHRNTVNHWRLYDPVFISRLNRMRAAVWNNSLDRLRRLLPKSVSILARTIASDDSPAALRAAIQLLKIAGTSRLAPRIGPDNTYDVLLDRAQEHRRREWSPSSRREMTPPTDDELADLHHALLRHIEQETDSLDTPPHEPSPVD